MAMIRAPDKLGCRSSTGRPIRAPPNLRRGHGGFSKLWKKSSFIDPSFSPEHQSAASTVLLVLIYNSSGHTSYTVSPTWESVFSSSAFRHEKNLSFSLWTHVHNVKSGKFSNTNTARATGLEIQSEFPEALAR